MHFMEFQKRILIYIPCYNCEENIIETMAMIPEECHDQIECLIIDNQSNDQTVNHVLKEMKAKKYPFKVHLIRNKKNYGYAGSQKTAYSLAINSPNVEYVIMLHGDGQYPSVLLKQFMAVINDDYAIVNGYRHKKSHPEKEETPWSTYCIIKTLSWIESVLTGFKQKEWHSGFVMYQTKFLKKIPLHKMSNTPHIDGEFLILAGVMGERTFSVPIYKKYKDLQAFAGLSRIVHVLNTFRIALKVRFKYYHRLLKNPDTTLIDYQFEELI